MASVKPTKIVSRKVTSSTTASPPRERSNVATAFRSTMFHATTASTPASAASGMKLASGAASSTNSEQEQRVQHAGHGAVRAGAHVGRRARDRARHADAAEQARGDVGDALGDELAVRAMPAARHAVGDDGRQQRLDGAEQRERDGARQHLAHLVPTDVGQRRQRQAARNAAEARADRHDIEPGAPPSRQRRPRRAINMPGQSGRQRFRPTMTAIVANDNAIVVPSNVGRARQSTGSLSISSPGSGSASVSPKQILDLAREDDDGDPGRESDGHGIGNELDVGAELQEADRREHRALPASSRAATRRDRAPARSPPRAR